MDLNEFFNHSFNTDHFSDALSTGGAMVILDASPAHQQIINCCIAMVFTLVTKVGLREIDIYLSKRKDTKNGSR